MRLINNNKGVTIIMLVITVIVLLLLTALAIFYSNNIAPEARVAAAYSSLKEIKRACVEAENSIYINPDEFNIYDFFGKNIYEDGTDVSNIESRCGLSSSEHFSKPEIDDKDKKVYKITPENDPDVKRRLSALELSKINNYYIVDLDNHNYYLIDGVKRKTGEFFYEYKEIQSLYEVLTASKSGD